MRLNQKEREQEIVPVALIRGSGVEALWPNFLVLLAFTVVSVSLSVWRFRKQIG